MDVTQLNLQELHRELRDIESKVPIVEHKKRQSLLHEIARRESDRARLEVKQSLVNAGIIEECDDEII